MLKPKYYLYYWDIESLCKDAGLYPAETEIILKWNDGGKGQYTNEINRLYSYMEYEFPYLYEKCLLKYYNYKNRKLS